MDINKLSIRNILSPQRRGVLLAKSKEFHMAYCVYSSISYDEIIDKQKQLKQPYTYLLDNIDGVHIMVVIAGVQHYLSLGLEEEWKQLTREVLL